MEDLQTILIDSKIELKELKEIHSIIECMEWCTDKYIILEKLSNSITCLEIRISRLEKEFTNLSKL